jgi:hypothetical protein
VPLVHNYFHLDVGLKRTFAGPAAYFLEWFLVGIGLIYKPVVTGAR